MVLPSEEKFAFCVPEQLFTNWAPKRSKLSSLNPKSTAIDASTPTSWPFCTKNPKKFWESSRDQLPPPESCTDNDRKARSHPSVLSWKPSVRHDGSIWIVPLPKNPS